jgi:membrane protein DedA with SNARE-associated domain
MSDADQDKGEAKKGWLRARLLPLLTQGEGEAKRGWLRSRFLPLLTLLLVIGIVVGVFFFYRSNPEIFEAESLKSWGYFGAFLISLVSCATIVLPMPGVVVLFTLGAVLPSATLVGLAGGAGAAIGELTGYILGYSGQAVLSGVSKQKVYTRFKGWVERWGFLSIFILSIVPFAFDLVGIAAGVLRFPVWKFLIASWLGRSILYTAIAWGGALGWDALQRLLD